MGLWPVYQKLSEELASFRALERGLDEKSSDVVAWLSDHIAGAERYKDVYRSDTEKARSALRSAEKSLHRGDQKSAARFLATAREHIQNAQSFRRLYLHATMEGADTAGEGLVASGMSVASGGLGGFLGLAIGIHGAVLSWWPKSEEKHFADLSPSNFYHLTDEKVMGPAGFGAHTPLASARGVSTQSRHLSSSHQSDEKKILAALDGPSSLQTDTIEEEIRKLTALLSVPKIQKKPDLAHEASVAEVGAVAKAAREKFNGKGKEALIAEARRVLEEWKRNKGAVPDYAHFLIAAETEKPEQNFKAWEEHLVGYKEAADIDHVMSRLFDDYLQSYVRGNAKLTDFLEGNGGNCEAQTKLIVSALTAVGSKLPEGSILAVQIFADHIQPVVYNKKSGAVWNLMKNRTSDRIDAPLFDPHILYYAYLQKEGESSPVEAKDLLIRAPERTVWEELPIVSPLAKLFQHHKGFHFYRSNTNLSFASLVLGNGINFAGSGEVPERARTDSPYYTPPKRVYAVTLKEVDFMARNHLGTDIRELLEEELKKNIKKDGFSRNEFTKNMWWNPVVLESEEDVNNYNTLSSDAERIAYLAAVYDRHLATMLDTPDMKQALEFFDRPAVVQSYQPDDISDAFNMLFQFMRGLEGRVSRIQEIYPGLNEEKLIRLLPERPLAAFFEKKQKAFQEKIKQHPLAFILLADRLSPHARRNYIRLITLAGSIRWDNPNPGRNVAREALGPILADKKLLGLKEKRRPEERKEELMAPSPLEAFDVDIVEEDIPVAEIPIKEAEREAKKERVDEARYKISPKTLAQFVLIYYDVGEVARRWSPRLSRAFLKMNRDGWQDQRFSDVYPTLKQHYPVAKREAVPDPHIYAGRSPAQNKNYPTYNDSHRIPRDFEPILAQIMERRKKQEDEKKVAAQTKTNSGRGILMSQ